MPINIFHSSVRHVLFDYALSQLENRLLADLYKLCKKSKVSTPDIFSLKNALKLDEAEAWKRR